VRSRKKKLEEAEIILANERLRKAEAAREADTPAKNVLTTTQWLSIISIIMMGIYYKREEKKKMFLPPKNRQRHHLTPLVDFTPPTVKNQIKGGIRPMD